MYGSFHRARAVQTLKLTAFVTFCVGVFLGGVVALPVLGEHFFGNRRQPVFVVDLLIFGGACAVLAAVLLSNKFGYSQWLKEWGRPAEPAQTAGHDLARIGTTSGEHHHHAAH
jgi:hypothetical protein